MKVLEFFKDMVGHSAVDAVRSKTAADREALAVHLGGELADFINKDIDNLTAKTSNDYDDLLGQDVKAFLAKALEVANEQVNGPAA